MGSAGNERKLKPFTTEDALVLVAGTVLALAGLRGEDPLTVYPCLAVAAGCYSYLFWVRLPTRWAQIIAVLLIWLACALFVIRGRAVIRETERKEARNGLSIVMMDPSFTKSTPSIPFTIRNDGPFDIISYKFTCILNKIADSSGGGIIVAPKGISAGWLDSRIASHDSQSEACPTKIFALSGQQVCADITIQVEYRTTIGSDIFDKKLRFVAAKNAGEQWYHESPEKPGNYCDGSAYAY